MKSIIFVAITLLISILLYPIRSETPQPFNSTQNITLKNSSASLEISPSIGRISSFKLNNECNSLWLNDFKNTTAIKYFKGWTNYGGDKAWPSPQREWLKYQGNSWPPDTSLDGSSWKVTSLSLRHVIIESPTSSIYKIKIIREITLDEKLPFVHIKTTYTRIATHPSIINVWTISQVPMSPDILVGNDENSQTSFKILFSDQKINLEKIIKRIKEASFSICFPNSNRLKLQFPCKWIAATSESYVFAQFAFPNSNSKVSGIAYAAPEEKYMEIEFIGPEYELKQNQSISLDVYWFLLQRNQMSLDEISTQIEKKWNEISLKHLSCP